MPWLGSHFNIVQLSKYISEDKRKRFWAQSCKMLILHQFNKHTSIFGIYSIHNNKILNPSLPSQPHTDRQEQANNFLSFPLEDF